MVTCSYNIRLFVAVLGISTVVEAAPDNGKSYADGFPFYSRKSWGAKKANDTRSINVPVPYVVIHHTYIPGRCDSFEQCSKNMRDLQKYHTKRGWGDIGYNFCVGSDGGAYEGRGWKVVGVHAGVANKYSMGICLIEEVPPPKQLNTAKALIASGVKRGIISREYKLIGHNQTTTGKSLGDALYKVISTWDHFTPAKFRDPNR